MNCAVDEEGAAGLRGDVRVNFAPVPGFLVFVLFTASGAALTPAERKLNVDSFEYVWTTVRDKHWDPKLGGLDWKRVHDELRPKIEQAESMEKARAVIGDMLSRLRQSHFGIVPAEVYRDMETNQDPREGATGLTVRVPHARPLVVAVEKGSPAEAAGVRPGWEILRIDGAAKWSGSTLPENILVSMLTRKLTGKTGTPVKILFRDGGNRKTGITLTRAAERGTLARFGYLPPLHVWIESRRIGSAGYVAFNLFFDPVNLMPAIEKAVNGCGDCRGFIIDLRGNPGGIGGMAAGIAGFFLNAPGKLGTMYTRDATLNFFVAPRVHTFDGPLAILVDGCSVSSAEIFAGGLRDLKRARIFGSRTAGAALPSAFEKLPNGDGFQYAMGNYISAGGKPLEGNGVIPDVRVVPTRKALLEGHDPALESALQWLNHP